MNNNSYILVNQEAICLYVTNLLKKIKKKKKI